MRVLIIGNPIAGVGRAGRRVGELGRLLQDRGCEVTTRLTRGPGEARAFAESVGDGTIYEAVNGLADPSGTPIAILGVGTANLLARDLNLPRTPQGVADLIHHGRTRMLDLGLIGGKRRFSRLPAPGWTRWSFAPWTGRVGAPSGSGAIRFRSSRRFPVTGHRGSA